MKCNKGHNMKLKLKYLIGFELTKVLIGFLNIIFLAQNYPEISFIISILSILTSGASAVIIAVAYQTITTTYWTKQQS